MGFRSQVSSFGLRVKGYGVGVAGCEARGTSDGVKDDWKNEATVLNILYIGPRNT